MTLKALKNTLVEMGFTLSTEINNPIGVKVYREYFVKNGICVRFRKIGGNKVTIHVFHHWDEDVNVGILDTDDIPAYSVLNVLKRFPFRV